MKKLKLNTVPECTSNGNCFTDNENESHISGVERLLCFKFLISFLINFYFLVICITILNININNIFDSNEC